MIKLILFLLMILIIAIFTFIAFFNIIRWILRSNTHKDCSHIKKVLKRNCVLLISVILLMSVYTYITQLSAYTPSIKDSNGDVIEDSISELRKVNLNNHNEYISIRGVNKDKPILLFLAGGPGGTQMAATRYELSELEKNFVVVNWDQMGSGKSYNCMSKRDITVQTYIEDGIALTNYLREQFNKDKIYLMGESFGSALGIFLINEKPEYYSGFIGTGQMVDFKETEKIDYNKAMEIAKDKGDEKIIKDLTKHGMPPYYDGIISLKSGTYLNYLSTYMASDPNITNGGYHTLRDMTASEYGALDSFNYLLGVLVTFDNVYPKLYDIDLRKDYTFLKVPVYFFIGRHDINAPTALAVDYFDKLDAPKKELVWFEHSGHSPWLNETDQFVKETLRVFNQ